MDIVTGHVGSAHVTSWQDRDLNQGIFGADTYILNVGSRLLPTIISNNEVHIADGSLMMQGCQGAIQKGTYDTITIDNGASGMKRYDLICAEYTKVGGVESLGWTVIKGTPSSSTPSEPSYTSGDIQNGDTPVQVPVFRVYIDGLTLDSISRKIKVESGIDAISKSRVYHAGNTVITTGTASFRAFYATDISYDPQLFVGIVEVRATGMTPGATVGATVTDVKGGGYGTKVDMNGSNAQANSLGALNLVFPTIIEAAYGDAVDIDLEVLDNSNSVNLRTVLYWVRLR